MKAACIKDDKERRLAREEADLDYMGCLLSMQDRAPFDALSVIENPLASALAVWFWTFRFNGATAGSYVPGNCRTCPTAGGSQ
jgi:hypothetical protein